MATLHEKSPCCRGVVRRYGGRRRQCGDCRRTWRAWPRRRGRRKKRVAVAPAIRYLGGGTAPTRILQKSVVRFLETAAWPPLPREAPLTVVADAVRQRVEGALLTSYLIAIRPRRDVWAVIAVPFFREGRESLPAWHAAFAELPQETLRAVRALVCDGHAGLLSVAHRYGWHIQRCHFHIIAKLQGRRSRSSWSRHPHTGARLFRLIQSALTNPSAAGVQEALRGLRAVAGATRSRQLRVYLSGFLTNHEQYRTYLIHPELHLPRTTNAVESIASSIRGLTRKACGFRTRRSFMLWVAALLKYKQRIRCNGAYHEHQPN